MISFFLWQNLFQWQNNFHNKTYFDDKKILWQQIFERQKIFNDTILNSQMKVSRSGYEVSKLVSLHGKCVCVCVCVCVCERQFFPNRVSLKDEIQNQLLPTFISPSEFAQNSDIQSGNSFSFWGRRTRGSGIELPRSRPSSDHDRA